MPVTREEALAFYKRKLAEARKDITRLRQSNRAYAREAERLWGRFYQDERTIQQLRTGRRSRSVA